MSNSTIGFIGGGNMARSLIGGMIADGRNAESIWVSDTNAEQLGQLKHNFGINTTTNNADVVAHADIVVMAVKPQMMKAVAQEVADAVQAKQPMVVSIAAGILEESLNRWLGGDIAIVRTMPNTPSLIQTGATALWANEKVTEDQRNEAESIMRTVGIAIWLEEQQQMDAVTALSGSGPAYFFLFMEAIEEAAIKLGLPAEAVKLLTLQTSLGAAKMAMESPEDCATLRRRVTSPGGTTEQAINTFEAGELRTLVEKALTAATLRSKELAEQLGE